MLRVALSFYLFIPVAFAKGTEHPCSRIPNDKYLVATTHNAIQDNLTKALLLKAKNGTLHLAIEGTPYGEQALFELAFGTSRGMHGMEDAASLKVTIALYLIQNGFNVYDKRKNIDLKIADSIDAYIESVQNMNEHIGQMLRGLINFDFFRDAFTASKDQFPQLDELFEKHKLIEMSESNPRYFEGAAGATLSDAVYLEIDPRKFDAKQVIEWIQLGRLFLAEGMAASKQYLDKKDVKQINAFVANPIGPQASSIRNHFAINLRDKIMVDNLGKICTSIENSGLPLVVLAGTSHTPALKGIWKYKKVFGEFTLADHSFEGGVVQLKGDFTSNEEMLEAQEYFSAF